MELGTWNLEPGKLITDYWCPNTMNTTVEQILDNYVTSGLYKDEPSDLETFQRFFQETDNLLRKLDSPRNVIRDRITDDVELHREIRHFQPDWDWQGRTQMLFDFSDQYYRKNFNKHSRYQTRIYESKIRLDRLLTSKSQRERLQKQLSKYKGRIPKTIETIIRDLQTRIDKQVAYLKSIEQEDAELRRFLKLKQHIGRYRKEWYEYNNYMGIINKDHGESLESEIQQVIDYIHDQYSYQIEDHWSNLHWNNDSSLGEVDLLLRTVDDIYIIVEFKCRAHDVMSAWYQNGPERKSDKSWLPVDGRKVIIDQDAPFFVVTTIPKHPYILNMESMLKRVISYRLKHYDLPIEEVYAYARKIISPDRLKPIDWYHQGGYNYVIVI